MIDGAVVSVHSQIMEFNKPEVQKNLRQWFETGNGADMPNNVAKFVPMLKHIVDSEDNDRGET